jgi:hypothetical protein
MKLNPTTKGLIIFFLYVLISYAICTTHEITAPHGYVTRRKRFCALPFWKMLMITIAVCIFIYYFPIIESKFTYVNFKYLIQ